MKYLTINHYNNLEFELSYSINGVFKQDKYISFDPTDESIFGLDIDVCEYENMIRAKLLEEYGDVIEEVSDSLMNDYSEYVRSIKGY